MLRHINDDKDPIKEEELESQEYYEKALKSVPWYHKVLLNIPLKVVICMVLLAIVAPLLVYYFYFQKLYFKSTVNDGFSYGTCAHNMTYRMRCGPTNISMTHCNNQCCYDEVNSFCYHKMPSRYSYIRVEGDYNADSTPRKWYHKTKKNISNVEMYPRQVFTPYPGIRNVKKMQLYANDRSERHTEFILYDKSIMSYPNESNINENKKYSYYVYREFYLEINSLDQNITKPLFTTARGPLIATDNLWEWSFHVGEDDIYGLGDVILNSNDPELLYNNDNRTSSLLFFLSQINGSYHGVYLNHNGPMEYTMLESKTINVKSFSGQSLDLHFFYGENPMEIYHEFSEYIGKKKSPPYWALGAHFCRSNSTFRNINDGSKNFTAFLNAANVYKLPYESDCIIDELFQFINNNMTEIDIIMENINSLTDELKRFMPSIRPHVRVDNTSDIYESAVDDSLLMLDPVEYVEYEGLLYNLSVVFPDYGLESTVKWLKDNWPFNFDVSYSFILKDNWPKNLYRTNECWVEMPYVTEKMNLTFCETLPWNTRRPDGKNTSHHIDHNLYGSNFASAIKKIAEERRSTEVPFILSASNSINSDSGFHLQNVYTSWESMRVTYLRAVADSMSGIQIQTVPVCGDSEEFTAVDLEKLCIKWYQAAVYLPMFYVLSNRVPRHPFGFSGFARSTMVQAVQTRYKLMPYFYTVMNKDEPLIRPMFYDFYDDENVTRIDEQFMVGDALMIAPIFGDRASTVNAYFPFSQGWYTLWGGSIIPQNESSFIEIPTLETEIPVFLRSGYIIPIQETIMLTAMETREKSKYSLIIGLDCPYENITCFAEGSLFIEDNIWIEFSANEKSIIITVKSTLEEIKPYLCNAIKISSNIINKIYVYGRDNVNNNYGNYYMKDDLDIDLCGETLSYEYMYI